MIFQQSVMANVQCCVVGESDGEAAVSGIQLNETDWCFQRQTPVQIMLNCYKPFHLIPPTPYYNSYSL